MINEAYLCSIKMIAMDNIHVFENRDELSDFFARDLSEKINAKSGKEAFSISLSGGSTPKHIFQYLSSHYNKNINWKKVHFFWGDERCVPPDNKESNFRMTKENLLKNIPIPENNIFRIKGENEPESEAKEYEKTIRKNIPSFNGIPVFDYVMLGLGDDGHTVSIFPDQLHLFDLKNLTAVATHPHSGQKRITITGQLINNARNIAFLVTGKAKAEMVNTIVKKKNGWQNLPSSKVQPTSGKLLFLLDKEAAALLAHES